MSMLQYAISANNKQADVLVYGTIGDDYDGISAKRFAEDLQKLGDVEVINVSLNSSGGNPFDGMAIYSTLSRHPARVVMTIDGMALSAASIVAMAGDTIRIAQNAMLMIHNPMMLAMGTAEEMRSSADKLDKIRDSLVGIYAARTGQKPEAITAWMDEEKWFDGAEAVAAGFADETLPAKKIAACGDLTNFKHVPESFAAQVTEQAAPAAGTAQIQEAQIMSQNNEGTDAAATADAPQAVTIAELKTTFPNSDAAWRETCLEAGATMAMAKDRWLEHLQDQAKAQAEKLGELETANQEMTAKAADLEAEVAKLKAAAESGEGGDEGMTFAGAGGATAGNSREAIIARAKADFVKAQESPEKVVCTEAAWVNEALRDAATARGRKSQPLTNDEKTKFDLAD